MAGIPDSASGTGTGPFADPYRFSQRMTLARAGFVVVPIWRTQPSAWNNDRSALLLANNRRGIHSRNSVALGSHRRDAHCHGSESHSHGPEDKPSRCIQRTCSSAVLTQTLANHAIMPHISRYIFAN